MTSSQGRKSLLKLSPKLLSDPGSPYSVFAQIPVTATNTSPGSPAEVIPQGTASPLIRFQWKEKLFINERNLSVYIPSTRMGDTAPGKRLARKLDGLPPCCLLFSFPLRGCKCHLFFFTIPPRLHQCLDLCLQQAFNKHLFRAQLHDPPWEHQDELNRIQLS